MTSRFLVYALTDPRTNTVRYVGKSSTGLRRPKTHGSRALEDGNYTHVANWIRSLKKLGMEYGIEVLEEVADGNAAIEAEKFWISYWRFVGADLTNLTDGGDGLPGWRPSAETRQKMRVASTGRFHDAETRQRISETKRGEKKPYMVTRNQRADIRHKVSVALLGHSTSEETRSKIGDANRGNHPSDEARKKMSLSHMGNPSMLGRKLPESTRQKMRESARRAWANRKADLGASA